MHNIKICLIAAVSMLVVTSCGSQNNVSQNESPAVTTTISEKPESVTETDKIDLQKPTETTTVLETTTLETTTETFSEVIPETTDISGTLSDDFDEQLDSMIANITIPEVPDINIKTTVAAETKPAETTSVETTKLIETTTVVSEPDVSVLKNEQQFVFDGISYDNETFVSAGITAPVGWVLGTNTASNQYENASYPESYIVEDTNKGAVFMISNAKSHGKTSYPSLQLYKGLTWGATADDIKSAYGEPAKEGHSEQYNTQLTNLFYKGSGGGLIVYEVSSDWGLIAINCFGK